jgi:hypothetical protein
MSRFDGFEEESELPTQHEIDQHKNMLKEEIQIQALRGLAMLIPILFTSLIKWVTEPREELIKSKPGWDEGPPPRPKRKVPWTSKLKGVEEGVLISFNTEDV